MGKRLRLLGGDVFNSTVRKIQGVAPSAFFLTLVDDADAATARTTLGVSAGTTLADFKDSVRVATTTAGTLATDFENGDTIDGVVLATGNRILLKDQSTASANGIYVVAASGAPTRATDFDADAEVTAGCVIPVTEGTANGDKLFILTTNDPITVGSTGLAFSTLTAAAAAVWSAITDPAGNLSLAMASNLTTFTWAGNFSTSSAFKLAGNNTSATGPLLHVTTASSNLIPPLLVEPRAAQRLKVGHLGDVVIGQSGIGGGDTDGYPFVPVVASNAFPSSTPTGQTGFAPIVAYSNGINTEYDLAIYLNSTWKSIGGARNRYGTSTGTGAQNIDWSSCTGAHVFRQFTFGAGNATFTFINPPPAGSLVTLLLVQDGTGGRTATWSGGIIKFAAGTAPVLTVTGSARDQITWLWDGSNYWEQARSLALA